MSPTAVALVLAAALAHSTWNLLAKRARDPLAFLWAALGVSTVLFAPFGLWAGLTYPPPPAGWALLLASVIFEVAYMWALGQGYRVGDLSVVYPVARGISPLLASSLGVAVLGEEVSSRAALGIVAIVLGILTAHLAGFSAAALRALLRGLLKPATGYAVMAGLCTGTYSTIDKVAVGFVWPPLYAYLIYAGTGIGMTFFLLTRGVRPRVAGQELRSNPGPLLLAGVLGPMAYGLVLAALSFTPVSYIAPAREVSVAFGVLLGAIILHEPFVLPRLTGAGLIAAGLFLLATG
jgi:drug/metabolite transporter (DMT)-like permease